jgi:hypothetical protein
MSQSAGRLAAFTFLLHSLVFVASFLFRSAFHLLFSFNFPYSNSNP